MTPALWRGTTNHCLGPQRLTSEGQLSFQLLCRSRSLGRQLMMAQVFVSLSCWRPRWSSPVQPVADTGGANQQMKHFLLFLSLSLSNQSIFETYIGTKSMVLIIF